MKLVDKTGIWDHDKTLVGRKKNYKITIHYAEGRDYWYFILAKEKYRYNSLWQDKKFTTLEDAITGVEIKIEELVMEKERK